MLSDSAMREGAIMYQQELEAVAQAAEKKDGLLRSNPLGYWVAAMLAGVYIGFGIILVFTIGGHLSAAGSPYTKLAMGLFFGAALSMVIMAGAELFTGNTLVMTVGGLAKRVRWSRILLVLVSSYVGNLIGAVVLSSLMRMGNLYDQNTIDYILSSAATKMNASFIKLFIAGILCNILVCLPVWCSYKLKSESAKLMMIFWGILMFVTPGFEHCVANMTPVVFRPVAASRCSDHCRRILLEHPCLRPGQRGGRRCGHWLWLLVHFTQTKLTFPLGML